MKHIGILKAGSWINIVNWVGIPFIVIYFICMFVLPLVVGQMDWAYTQSVWHRWQSLNVGVLALTSSLIAFSISRFNADKQRAREFVAASAFLPEALSELTSYFQSCSPILKEAWYRANNETDKCKTPLKKPLPQLPSLYKEIFSRCIVSSEPDVGEHLANILTRLQINHSRLQSLINEFSEDSNTVQIPRNIISKMYCLGELQALVNKIFEFARGQEQFNAALLKFDEFGTAYFGLDFITESFEEDLSGFTERAVEKASKSTNI